MAPRTNKETVVLVLNVGVTVNDEVDTEFMTNAKTLMKRVIEKKIFVRDKDEVGIVLMGRRNGNHRKLDNIDVYNRIQVCTWDMVQKVSDINPEDCCFKRWNDGVSAAVELIQQDVQESTRITIIVLSDCYSSQQLDANDLEKAGQTIVEKAINLLWIGTKPLGEIPRANLNYSEKMLLQFRDLTQGDYKTFNEVLPRLRFYGGKIPRPTGIPFNLEIAGIIIPVKIYVYVTEHKPVKFSKVALKPGADGDDVVPVKKNRELVDRHKQKYDEQNTTKGVLYGRKFIPLGEEDHELIRNNDTKKSFMLRGFMDKQKFKTEHRSGSETHMVLPGENGQERFFALVKAMAEKNQVAIVRKVHAMNNNPGLKVLYPQVDEPGQPTCLLMYSLPYRDTFREVDLQPYEKVLRSISDEQLAIVDTFIDEMMLIDPSIDCEDQRTFEPGSLPNPNLQHEWDVLADRAFSAKSSEDYEFPPRQEDLMKVLSRPDYLKNHRVDRCIDRINELFHLNEEPKSDDSDEEPTVLNATATQPTAPEKAADVPASIEPSNLPPPIDIDMDDLFDDD